MIRAPTRNASGRGQYGQDLGRYGHCRDQEMTSPYLQRPVVPLAAALSQMLENIETELANEKLEAGEKRRLGRRAKLMRSLLTPRLITETEDRNARCGSGSPGFCGADAQLGALVVNR